MDGLTYEDYEEGLRMSLNQRVSHSNVIDYINTTLIPPLETSKNLHLEFTSSISFLYDTYGISAFASQYGVTADYINNLSALKSKSLEDIKSKLEELGIVTQMINKVIAFSNSSITKFHTVSNLQKF